MKPLLALTLLPAAFPATTHGSLAVGAGVMAARRIDPFFVVEHALLLVQARALLAGGIGLGNRDGS